MLAANWMSRDIIAVDENDSMQAAIKLLKEHDISMLPVMKEGKLVGIVTDRDLKRASASDATSLEIHELFYLLTRIKVKDIMTRQVITVPLEYTAEETAQVLLKNKISGAPVVDSNDRIVGTITKTDLFRVLISLTGIGVGGIQFGLQVEDKPGSIKAVADIIRKYGGRMVSILTSYDNLPDGWRHVYIRMRDIERSELENLKAELKSEAGLLYVVDHTGNKRAIFTEQIN